MIETERHQIKGALLKCAEENENKFTLTGHIVVSSLCRSAVERIEELEKENAELKEKISVLLSCKNCPENKGGWGCEKEYEGRCLSQKVMYIKELKAEMKEQLAKAKELIEELSSSLSVVGECEEEECELLNRAEQFLKESK